MKKTYLFIGLGDIGLPIALRISKLKLGNFFIHDKNKKLLKKITKKNKFLKVFNNFNEIDNFDIIFTCLPDSKTVKLVYNKINKNNFTKKIICRFLHFISRRIGVYKIFNGKK